MFNQSIIFKCSLRYFALGTIYSYTSKTCMAKGHHQNRLFIGPHFTSSFFNTLVFSLSPFSCYCKDVYIIHEFCKRVRKKPKTLLKDLSLESKIKSSKHISQKC